MVQTSIIIPVYNGEKYVKQAVESAKNQKDSEVIVIDDGSTDNTLNIITQIDGIEILIKPNGGTASALNLGIKRANGEWIRWLSADDVMLPDSLEKMFEYVIRKDVIYYTDYDIINENNEVIGEFLEPKRENNNNLWSYFYGNGSTSLIHKSVFEKCGLFDDSLKHSEDYEFWLRASMKFNIDLKHIPIKTIQYRRHQDQLTKKVGGSLDDEIRKKITIM